MRFVNYKDFTKSIFRGIGQVMLQNNAATGLVFLAGVFYASWLMGFGALIGVLTGTIAAMILRYKEKDILDGLSALMEHWSALHCCFSLSQPYCYSLVW